MRAKTAIITLSIVAAAVLATLFIASQNILTQGQQDSETVAVTWGLLGEVVHRLTDGTVTVYQILPPGAEIHDWEPAPDVLEKVRNSRILFWTVEGFDDWGEKLAASANVKAFKVSTGVELMPYENGHGDAMNHEHIIGAYDPHFWLDPERFAAVVRNMAQILSDEFPEKKEAIQKNSEAYIREILQLRQQFEEALSRHRGKTFITQHNAFRYLATAFGLETVAVLSGEEEEPSAAHLAEIYELIERNGVKTIFAEDGSISPVLENIARDLGMEIKTLYTMETLHYDDYLRGQGYIMKMRHNLSALVDTFEH
ncbi:MAG: zinc ABC transporter substrate-binding protein [Candidatus Caldarchaeum sp.]